LGESHSNRTEAVYRRLSSCASHACGLTLIVTGRPGPVRSTMLLCDPLLTIAYKFLYVKA